MKDLAVVVVLGFDCVGSDLWSRYALNVMKFVQHFKVCI
jgi:hypothetical protein